MNFFSKKLPVVFVSALLAFTGCTKKPKRPDPTTTAMGMTGGAGGLNPGDPSNMGPTDGSAAGLVTKNEGDVIDDGKTIHGLLQSVYFDFDKSGIKESERPKLQAAKEYLEKNPQQRLLLEGHCDWKGTAEYNLGLGDRRAGASKAYLQKLGVAPAKLEVLSKGSLDAKEKGTSDDMIKDRRVELVVIKAP